MEAIIFTFVFVLALVAYFVLAARAGLAEDADWSRLHALAAHGVHLGLEAGERAAWRPDLLAPPCASERLPVAVTPPDPDRWARPAAPAAPDGTQVFVSNGFA